MKIIVVNENDEILGYKERDDRNKTDIIRVSGLWLVNSKKEALIAQRSLSKVHDPGKWGPSAAGTVEEGETYLTNILKEAKEELGLILRKPEVVVGKHHLVNTDHKYFVLLHFAKSDLPATRFKVQRDEVEQVKWIKIAELSKLLEELPQNFTASFATSLNDLKIFLDSN